MEESSEELMYVIALGQVKDLNQGDARKLMELYGSAKNIFTNPRAHEANVRLPSGLFNDSKTKEYLENAKNELAFVKKNKVHAVLYSSDLYPYRLKQCYDAPIVLFLSGHITLDQPKVISIVGTRMSTAFGRELCDRIVKDLAHLDVLIVSGLADGIDSAAHKSALKYGLKTAAVVGHGLNRIYPRSNLDLAKEIIKEGSIISDYPTFIPTLPHNFLARNRIIAGLSDACVIVESKIRGGSLATANFAHSYSRDVFAVPGKPTDKNHRGPNNLIKVNKAALIETGEDIINAMNWTEMVKPKNKQLQLFENLNEQEIKILKTIQENSPAHLDLICRLMGLNIPSIVPVLLGLEFKNKILSKPGNCYTVCAE